MPYWKSKSGLPIPLMPGQSKAYLEAKDRMSPQELRQIRMQAIEAAIKQSNRTGFLAGENYILNLADLYVHYCLTGEHQLPEKKDD